MSAVNDYDLSRDDRDFVNLITNAIDTCDTAELMRLKKDILILLNKEAKLPYSNRNKEELIQQLTQWKGCWCNLRDVKRGVGNVCKFVSPAIVAAAVFGAVAAAVISPLVYAGSDTAISKEVHSLTVFGGLTSGMVAAGSAASRTQKYLGKKSGNPLIKEAYEPSEY